MSNLGFGIMRMPMKDNNIDYEECSKLIDEYMSASEFCYFDVHPAYMNGKSQDIFRENVSSKYSRTEYMIANKMPYTVKTSRDYEVVFEKELLSCGVDYFDVYFLHAVTSLVYEQHLKLNGFEFLKKIKEEGRALYIGISFHDSPELLDRILKEHPEIDIVQLQINFVDWDNSVIQSRRCYEVARKYNKRISVMEPIKGGSITNISKNSGLSISEIARISLSFVAELPGIDVVLSGMSRLEHVKDNVETFRLINKSNHLLCDYSQIENLKQLYIKAMAIRCTNCRYCILECPKKINIPDIIELLNLSNNHGVNDRTFLGRYKIFYDGYIKNGGEKASECIRCGKCEGKCPQKLSIRKYMWEAARIFERKSDMNYYTVERNSQMLIYLLKAFNIKKIVVSPGATNICFAYSVQQDGFFELYSAADERSAAYIACGLAAESGEPVVISCTGATASRNYMPGLTEAYYRKLPIIAVTSTQPRDRYGNGFPQFIDRRSVPNDIAKMSVYIPSIHSKEDELNAEVNLNRALLELNHHGFGPVHINLETEYKTDYSVRVLPPTRVIKRCEIEDEFPMLESSKKIGIFIGAHERISDELCQCIDSFCEEYDAVVLCDQTSNYHGKYGVMASLITYQERQTELFGFFDILIHLGEISGAYMRIRAKEVWRVNKDGAICDYFRTLKNVFEMDEKTFFRRYLKNEKNTCERVKKYQEEYKRLYANIPDLPFSNIWAAKMLAPNIPQNSIIHLAILNSLRSWNFFEVDKSIDCYSNTGGFGIDGCVSSLIGASLSDENKLYFGIVGDLAFFYDLNSIGNRDIGNNLRILLISNGCGTEFKNYDHIANRFGKDADPFIAARGHYGNKSKDLVKNYAENLGFEYFSASDKDEFLNNMKTFVNPSLGDKSIVFEIFTNSAQESEALQLIRQINGKRQDIVNNENNGIRIPEYYKEGKEKFTYVLWGTGACFEKNLSKVEEKNKIEFACDNNSDKWGKEVVKGIKIISPEELKEIPNVFVIIMLENIGTTMQVANQLIDLGIYRFDSVYNWLKY